MDAVEVESVQFLHPLLHLLKSLAFLSSLSDEAVISSEHPENLYIDEDMR